MPALLLLLVFAVSMFAVPLTSAHSPGWTVPTWTYVSVTNNPIGVNQQVVIVYWCDKYPPTAVGAYGDRWTFNLEITQPDGTKEIQGPFTSDPIGTGYLLYTPTQVGEYTIVVKMDEHVITGLPYPPGTMGLYRGADSVNDTYLASQSNPLTLVVQSDPIESWTETPLPTEYWTRPINAMNRNWWQIAGNWLSGTAMVEGPTTNINAYSTGPESAHIMWSREFWAGGLMDGRFGAIGYQTSHYSGLSFAPPIILNGVLYYNVGSHPRIGWYAVDLYTGQTLYFHNTTGAGTPTGTQELSGAQFDPEGSIVGESLSFGQIYNYESPNQHGGFPYLWSTTSKVIGYNNVPGVGTTPIYDPSWMMFDAATGNYICSIANVSASGTQVYGKDGSILYYNIVGSTDKRLTVWNTSQAIWYREQYQTNQYWMWRPYLNYTFGGQYGFSLNVSIPNVQGSIRAVREDQFVIGGTAGSNNEDGVTQGHLWALNLDSNKGDMGSQLWDVTFTPPSSAGNKTISMGTVDPEDGVFLFSCSQTREWWCYSLETGQLLWGPSDPEIQMNFYGMRCTIYQGNLYSYGSGQTEGELICYDIKTGVIKWRFTPAQEGFESPYGNYPLSLACIAEGKLYFYSSEHSPTQPFWRGSYLRCIDATTGQEIWKINPHGSVYVADGYLVGLNMYDNQIYCYGKGPTVTTVTSDSHVPLGSSVLIQGTVMDMAAGTTQTEQAARFPDGVPAMSDEDMTAWMQYVYMQQSKPANAQGVKVHLTAIDPNGNFQDIGIATSNILGNYAIDWTPPVPGLYTVTATFEGSESYYSSEAGTSFVVSEAAAGSAATPVVTQAPTETAVPSVSASIPVQSVSPLPSEAPQPSTSATSTTTYIAVVLAVIVIVAAAVVLALRRHR
ncbi:MAG: hypothetical protein NWF00_07000 [Candidatus Bathyarchaeota archaeon]|nr:hypothetical protein [Candidatus Bathyarchaeota archaeon]